ncbi:uncharacterized protein EDB93DRAFT_1255511 [Suillus bovinus]|uniref:uncharacterized protein n=1 Tax=Suillus bovinus TaxID=48563 RepID=UPI001B867854|nr:uncharacterized protein EDB93DRAFT_1255511 [Suillus bovinus]KAG2131404.1 hypothetical protein EDB93DRAFT_1255511 [Suillus bovinus]
MALEMLTIDVKPTSPTEVLPLHVKVAKKYQVTPAFRDKDGEEKRMDMDDKGTQQTSPALRCKYPYGAAGVIQTRKSSSVDTRRAERRGGEGAYVHESQQSPQLGGLLR